MNMIPARCGPAFTFHVDDRICKEEHIKKTIDDCHVQCHKEHDEFTKVIKRTHTVLGHGLDVSNFELTAFLYLLSLIF